jgi:hypothetical protein
VLHLALADQRLHRARDIFDGNLRVDPVLIEKVDAIGAQPLERRLRHLANVLRPAVHRVGAEPHAELRRDDDLAPDGRQCFAHEIFVGERAVSLGRVEEGDAAVDGRADELDHLRAIRRRAIGEAHSHAAEADGRNFETACS